MRLRCFLYCSANLPGAQFSIASMGFHSMGLHSMVHHRGMDAVVIVMGRRTMRTALLKHWSRLSFSRSRSRTPSSRCGVVRGDSA
jgi:hypothetical protein